MLFWLLEHLHIFIVLYVLHFVENVNGLTPASMSKLLTVSEFEVYMLPHFRLLHSSNACLAIVVIDFGKYMNESFVHPANARYWIFLMLPSGIVTMRKLVHPSNADGPISWTGAGMT